MSPEELVLQARWQRVLDAPDNDEAHAALVEHCRASGRLAEAARRYREEREKSELCAADRERIDRRLADIASVALSQIDATPHEPPGISVRRALPWIAIALFLATLLALARALTL